MASTSFDDLPGAGAGAQSGYSLMDELLASRLSALSQQALIELVVTGCKQLPALRARADALIAEAQLPTHLVEEVLLSADLLPHIMSTLSFQERAAAATCSAWSVAYAMHIGSLFIVRPAFDASNLYISTPSGVILARVGRGTAQITVRSPSGLARVNGLPTIQRTINTTWWDLPDLQSISCICMLPGGVLAVAAGLPPRQMIQFEAAGEHTDLHILAEYRSSALASKEFFLRLRLGALAATQDALLCVYPGLLLKFALAGEMPEAGQLALAEASGSHDLAVHAPSQRAFVLDYYPHDSPTDSIFIINATTMQLVSTVEADTFQASELWSMAVDDDSLIVAHDNGLTVLDLDGHRLRSLAYALRPLDQPKLAVAHGRIYIAEVDYEADPASGHLVVLDSETGEMLQHVALDLNVSNRAKLCLTWAGLIVDGSHVDESLQRIFMCPHYDSDGPGDVLCLTAGN